MVSIASRLQVNIKIQTVSAPICSANRCSSTLSALVTTRYLPDRFRTTTWKFRDRDAGFVYFAY